MSAVVLGPDELRTESEPESQPSCDVVFRMLRTRIVTVPFKRGSLLVEVPEYVAVVSW